MVPVFGGNGIMGYSTTANVEGELVIVGRVGEKCGSVHYYAGPAWITDNALYVREYDRRIHPSYLAWVLKRMDLGRLRNKGGQPLITQSALMRVGIPVPSLKRQRQVGEVMYSIEREIRCLDDLSVVKLSFKRALMQALLGAVYRLAGFRGFWTEYRLEELFSQRVECNRPDLPLLSITADRGVIPREDIERRDTSNPDKTAYLRIAPGDIGYNTMRMWQGVSALSSLDGIVSPAYTICVPNTLIDGRFATILFKHEPIVHLFRRYSQGLVDDTLSLKFHDFAQIRVRIPEIAEQRAIAAVFVAIDDEMGILTQLKRAREREGNALLDKLLFGEIPIPAS